jgi:hypothetical protein
MLIRYFKGEPGTHVIRYRCTANTNCRQPIATTRFGLREQHGGGSCESVTLQELR